MTRNPLRFVALLILVAMRLSSSTAMADEVVLFPYFLGNGESGVYLAYSNDGRTFQSLNDARPIFTPPKWPDGQHLTRDPSIVFHDGQFHMVWTSNWSGRIFGYANSPDLVTWSPPRQITPFAVSLPEEDQPDNVWAPEIHFDPVQENFQIVFSSTTPREEHDGDGSADSHGFDHRPYEIRTEDFQTFTPAKVLFDQGFSVIDAQLTRDGDRWVMVVKRETPPPGGKNLRLTFNNLKQSGEWSPVGEPILGPGSQLRPQEQVEGPCLIRFGGQWLLYADAFTSHHYTLVTSPDLETWTDETDKLSFPVANPRHGTALVVDRERVGWFAESSDDDSSVSRSW